ncbi:hypothetical protein [Pararobbsia silviterrae]|uniref:hypothetical protein n=1 Tax=Pararobbsia silviterrae TaxID=1792498 RepID=UPI0013140C73|nr:hypothetical protein [Pararobbsia silviterrae]
MSSIPMSLNRSLSLIRNPTPSPSLIRNPSLTLSPIRNLSQIPIPNLNRDRRCYYLNPR